MATIAVAWLRLRGRRISRCGVRGALQQAGTAAGSVRRGREGCTHLPIQQAPAQHAGCIVPLEGFGRTVFRARQVCKLDACMRQHMVQMPKPLLHLGLRQVDPKVAVHGKSNEHKG
eukprot:353304-Chlamydomonas_euryale.AAC.9